MAEITLTIDNFEEEVLKSDVPVLVDFWASWCGPCKMLGPVISEIADESDGSFKVGKVNVDDEPELAEQYGIMSIPSIFVLKGGEVVNKQIGLTTKKDLLAMIKP
ncbi:MAG: thioredoxin [Lachnospiraceae bacterium]|nr:thioredoxin [Lachnospiraceae bacterium]